MGGDLMTIMNHTAIIDSYVAIFTTEGNFRREAAGRWSIILDDQNQPRPITNECLCEQLEKAWEKHLSQLPDNPDEKVRRDFCLSPGVRQLQILKEAQAYREPFDRMTDAIGFKAYAAGLSRDVTYTPFNHFEAGQRVLLNDPLVVDLRDVGWPDWADELAVSYCFESVGGSVDISRTNTKRIPRPVAPWRPKDGEFYWAWTGDLNQNKLRRHKTAHLFPPGKYAAFRNLDEIEFTWKEFVTRGDYWEAV
jgi:hypothetical protein